MRRIFAGSLSVLLLLWIWAEAAPTDPLFQRMEGEWRGEGTKTALGSGRRTRFEAEVRAKVEEDQLVSFNRIRETPIDHRGNPTAPAREYERVYWIRALSDRPGYYELGYGGPAGSLAAAEGHLEGEVFTVEQNLGGRPPLVVRSRTEFQTPQDSVYEQVDWYGESRLFETRVHYRRVSPSL